MTGLLTLTFTEDISIPANYKKFNSSVLKLTIIPGIYSNINDLSFDYTITSFTTSQILI